MKKNKLFYQTFFIIFFSGLTSFSFDLIGQCQQFSADYAGSICDDNGTLSDNTDDMFIANILVEHPQDPSGTWSSSDGTYTNEPYVGSSFYPFGPYPISSGDVSITIIDDGGCPSIDVLLLAPMPCSMVDIECPEFDLCLSLASSDNCCATYIAQFTGDLDAFNSINLSSFSFSPASQIENVGLLNNGGSLFSKGVTINGFTITGGIGLTGTELTSPSEGFIITICGDDGEEITPSASFPGMFLSGMPCNVNSSVCPPTQSYTAMGAEVGGSVYVPGEADCPDTQNHGVEGADITITSASGEECESTSSNDGSFRCSFCDDGPYEVCVTTTCPEPCDVNILDLFELQRYMLELKQREWFYNIVGDFSGDGNTNPHDLLTIRKYILGIPFPPRDSYCEFLSVNDAANLEDIQNQDNCTSISDPSEKAEFVRLMVGDINFTCTDCIHGDGVGSIPIVSKKESPTKTTFESPTNESMIAFSLAMDIAEIASAFTVTSPLQNVEYAVIDNQLKIIWLDPSSNTTGITVNQGEPLVEITSSIPNALSSITEDSYISTISGISRLSSVRPRSVMVQRGIDIGSFQTIQVDDRSTRLEMRLYDIMGRVIASHSSVADTDYIDFRPDVSNGIYILNVDDGYETKSYKIVLQSN